MCLNEIAGFERFENEQHDAACEILYGAGERHTDGHTAGSEEGSERGGVNAEGADRDHNKNNGHHDAHERGNKRCQRAFGMTPIEDLREENFHPPNDPRAEQINDDSRQHFETEMDSLLNEVMPKRFGVGDGLLDYHLRALLQRVGVDDGRSRDVCLKKKHRIFRILMDKE